MEKVGIELGGESVACISGTKLAARRSTFALRVAALDHEILYDSMEEGTVIEPFLCKFYEVVPVCGSLVVQTYSDVT